MNASEEAKVMLNRIVGEVWAQQRIIAASGANKLQGFELAQVAYALCRNTPVGPTVEPLYTLSHRTTKREASTMNYLKMYVFLRLFVYSCKGSISKNRKFRFL